MIMEHSSKHCTSFAELDRMQQLRITDTLDTVPSMTLHQVRGSLMEIYNKKALSRAPRVE